MTGRRLEEPAAAGHTLNAGRRRRYGALSTAVAAGHPSTVVAAAASVSPPGLSRMIRQDTARPPGQRLLAGLRIGKVDGRAVRMVVTTLPLDEPGGSRP